MKDGPTAPELAADAHDCIMVRSSKNRPNTRLRRDQRLIAGSASDFVAGANAAVHVTSRSQVRRRQTTCEDEDRELRRQAIPGMATAKARAEIDRSARPSKGVFMPRMEGSASLTPNQPEDSTESSVWGNLPLTRKAPYKVKNLKHPAYRRVQDQF